MDILYERVAGLDVHKDTVVACVRIMADGKTKRECRTFATTTEPLAELRAWLEECRCTHVAMEATGVYWMPVFKILGEGKFELIVANAAHIKNVPGRKTDINDATWIADLLACGLIKASFVPTEEMQELRSLTRTRKQLVREQTRHVQRIEKTLAEANIKLNSVISDIMGASGRRIIEAMIAGVRQPRKLADLASKQIKAAPKELYDALHGRLTDHHRFLLELHLRQWDGLDETIRKIDREIDQRIARLSPKVGTDEVPFRTLIELLHTVPGVSTVAAPAILSEIGPRHEPVPDRWPSRRLGRPVPRAERERRQAQILAPAKGSALAQDHARAMRLGCQAQERQLLPSPVLPPAKQPRTAEGHLCRRRIDPHRDLSHSQGRHRAPRPRHQLLRSATRRGQSEPPRCTPQKARLHRPTTANHGGRLTPSDQPFLPRSAATKQSMPPLAAPWIASLRSQ